MQFKDLCKRRVFDKTYWGAFTITDEILDEITVLAKNRDEFAIRHILIERITTRERPNGIFFDHFEMYRNANGLYFVIVSPYSEYDLTPYYFDRIDPLYSYSSTSWCKVFDSMKSYRNWLKGIK